MEIINNIITAINDNFLGYILMFSLVGAGIYFTLITRGVQFTNIREMMRLLVASEEEATKHHISPFQAFAISTAARVGTGNIAGVAIAITTAGPGAIFWMWAIAVVSSASAFVESTLAQIYKVKDGKHFRGGPAYYMQYGLGKRWLGVAFAVIISLTFGFVFNSVQSNTISQAFCSSFSVSTWVSGIIVCIITAIIIFGGLKRIAHFTQVIVPFFAITYILLTLVVVIINIDKLPAVIADIFTQAFSLRNIAGGTLGATIMMGARRGLFSNEAGMGSAPNAAATAKVSHPVKQGYVQALSVFVDTLIICSCTAFIVLLSDYQSSDAVGIALTQFSLTQSIGAAGGYFITFCLFLFAFTSIIGNYYYGQSNIQFITQNKNVMLAFRVLVIGMVMFGALTEVAVVWNLADLFMAVMAIMNIVSIILLGKFAVAALQDYLAQKKNGIKEPVFNPANIKGLTNTQVWKK
ncbi:AGCS family alanine or glycine:cation symporter [Elusimicrobium simillimum]|uniref:alanine/glycine:cation symporter family protein n=1 Tax=Elusimicrobium simillimum TaxID=3143438 RepID=UPI003C6F123B